MMGGPPTDPHMGSLNYGFGPEMHPNVEIRHAPHRQRMEHQEMPEHKKQVTKHPVHLPGGEIFSSGSDKYMLYGTLEDSNQQDIWDQTEKLKSRSRINCVPALNALFLPWVMFLFVFSMSSFDVHYTMPALVFCTNGTIVLCIARYAYKSFRSAGVTPDRSVYPKYLAVMLLISVSFGWLLGDLNFWFNMQPAYNIEHLATYNNVNPSTTATQSGQQVPTGGKRYQDAGKVYFEHNAVLDLNRSMSFKMGDLYCVAPIIDPDCKKNCGFDFWAVGMNCCAEDVADFRCGEYNNPAAKAGLRLMHDEQRPNFRLAVLEAEGVHKVVSTHPVFFYWLHDPIKELSHIKRKGYREFVLLMIVSFFGYGLAAFLSLRWAREKFRDT